MQNNNNIRLFCHVTNGFQNVNTLLNEFHYKNINDVKKTHNNNIKMCTYERIKHKIIGCSTNFHLAKINRKLQKRSLIFPREFVWWVSTEIHSWHNLHILFRYARFFFLRPLIKKNLYQNNTSFLEPRQPPAFSVPVSSKGTLNF